MIDRDLDRRLAARMAAEREARGWSVADLAARSGVSRAMIAKIERGTAKPTASLLVKVATAFGMPLSLLLARVEDPPSRLSRRAEQLTWRDPRTRYRRRAVSPVSDTALQLTEVELPPGARLSFPAVAYTFAHHQIWVLSGQLRFHEGKEVHDLSEGDCLMLGAPADCAYHNVTRRTCRYLVVVARR
jgi:transcriptional regulator with XRE-family HTH domain